MKKRVIVSWSSGKDSTLSLCRLLESDQYEVVGLYTTYVNGEVPFQATPLEIVKAQAHSIGLPLILIELDEVFPPNEIYQSAVIDGIRHSGLDIDAVAFGDMFCNGIEAYRRSYIEPQGWECVFPLLGESSQSLAKEVIQRGIVTRLTTIDTTQLSGDFLGRWFDASLLSDLPEGCDPCGEDGEFHTLVTSAPCFRYPLEVKVSGEDRSGRFHHLRYQQYGVSV
ncbi:adenine nucleotide alpha hydrolase [Enterovibrio paralichthyis]|uniref:adenine nucleotide alpha hydrolase n=1 Tax=Enterovibrio paralichthyis TaxID=2853805 RepID=UPI001C474D6A|nr:adenine nucleotide alpha hydrolase [Enterovibrio paralichthyis]MBV7301005.1 adenine nucleotide alpha hydrolase [Enterovibrio paralichthyis]